MTPFCSECWTDADCTDPALPICETDSTYTCVECTSSGQHCSDPTPVCDKSGAYECVACTANGNCDDPDAPFCSTTLNACVECRADQREFKCRPRPAFSTSFTLGGPPF